MRKVKKGITYEDFVANREDHNYIFLTTRKPWPKESIDAQFPKGVALLDDKGEPVLIKTGKKKGEPVMISASAWLDMERPVHQLTWAPGLPQLIVDKVVDDGGWIEKPGAVCLNLYRPPTLKPKRGKVKPWLDHIKRIYPKDADHIIKYLAHRVQHPHDKINHALLLGGAQGVGKDTMLEPIKYAVGPWNFAEVSPIKMMSQYNGFLKSVVLRISEAHDLGESNRFTSYEHIKTYTAAPPDMLRVSEKYMHDCYVFNCCGVIITTNHKTDGIYLPADDRRHYVAWSDAKKEDFSPAYWKKLWKWYGKGGNAAIMDYLGRLDLRSFDAKAPPPKTDAFWAIVDANRAPEEGELADVIDKLGRPDAVTMPEIKSNADTELREWLDDKRNRRVIPYRLESVGYVPIRNKDASSGLWTIDKLKVSRELWPGGTTVRSETYSSESIRMVIYAKSTLPLRGQLAAVQTLRQRAAAVVKERIAEKAPKATKVVSEKGNGARKPVHF